MSVHNMERDTKECFDDLVIEWERVRTLTPAQLIQESYDACSGGDGVEVFTALSDNSHNFIVDIRLSHYPTVIVTVDTREANAVLFVSNQSNPSDGREEITIDKEWTDALEEYLAESYDIEYP